jgi:Mce-associated membrane protein
MSDTRIDTAAALREAEAEATEAEAQAATARVRAQELRERRTLEKAPAPEAENHESTAEAETDSEPVATPPAWWRSGSLWRSVAESAAGIAVLALVATSAFFLYQDRQAEVLREQQSEFAEAARQGVVNLMSLDFNNAQADIQRVIDGTTGEFHDDFASSTNDFMTVMKESKVVTTATVSATAVETMSDDSAVVLVAATSQVANSVSMQANPRIWRLSVTVDRVDDQIKMSKVEFVP